MRSILCSLPDDDLYLILFKAKELFKWAPATSKVTIPGTNSSLELQVEQLKRKVEELELALANANNTNMSLTICTSPSLKEKDNDTSRGIKFFKPQLPNLKSC